MDLEKSLFSCSKPYQYVGGELFSANKDFSSAKVRFAMCFPDKYEIGISNLGVRILYTQINNGKNWMCDRCYAPEPDFEPETLYGLESKKPLKKFDALGFSLQYELSYPTVLKMLDMSNIPYRNDSRSEDDPIIIAGGPCAYNPLPLSDFIDVFMIGDGESSIVEICEILEKTKGQPRKDRIKAICEGKGRWSASIGGSVEKRIDQLTYETALKSYPIPFSSSIHDRAIIEIRRGCGRMCRFCQPGHVTLPVRERNAEDIIKISKELVHSTGYDEYSLLSLSSNDYSNIKEVIKELSCEFDAQKIGVSLPSQRIDGFNLELAELTQSVRKSTMTLAPEAGSQRLRNVIKKNISESQIVETALTLYENGWSRIKFYFIAGLPTETIEDMDEMAALLGKIRYLTKNMKKEKGLNHSLDITCTLSVFVPKPFTPFQYCPQMSLEKVTEHIHYLKDKIKNIKGVKVNYHETFTSQIEAVLTRGDKNLCKYIEALFKKGCYLDAWGEYFDKKIWAETATECDLELETLAQKEYSTEDILPWDFINTGLDKKWLADEYHKAFSAEDFQPTCEHKCVNCGVCTNLKTKKVLDKPFECKNYVLPEKHDPKLAGYIETVKYRIKLTKEGVFKYFSHLDWQNTFLKALSRSKLNVAFSQGFNPTMKVSMGIALPLFTESVCELVDIELLEELSTEDVKNELRRILPDNCKILDVKKLEKGTKSIDTTAQWAEYEITPLQKDVCNFESFMYNCNVVLSSDEILLTKKNKKGLLKTANVKSSVKSFRFENEKLFVTLKTGQGIEIPALRADNLMKLICNDTIFKIKRLRFFDDDLKEL